jgi:signal transduction histidine kinase
VAKGAAPERVFDAVVAEMHMLLGADNTRLMRYEPGDTVTIVAVRSDPETAVPEAGRFSLEGDNISSVVRRTGRSARLDSFTGPPGSIADMLNRLRISSAAGAPIIVEGGLWGVVVAAWRKHQPGPDIEDRIAQFTELVATAISNAQAKSDLATSRARVVAASDQTRRRNERDLHAGVQQRLVSLGLQLRVAQAGIPPDRDDLRQELARLADGVVGALDELRELSRGIHPAVLSAGGLGPALSALARRSAVPVELDVDVKFRLPEQVEAAAYFVASEALANSAKHANASVARIRVEMHDGVLTEQINDDGIGGADPSRGTGLIGLTDRVEALGGRITVSSNPGAGTQIQAEFPVQEGHPASG